MTAEEMFKELGYEKRLNAFFIEFDTEFDRIIFDLKTKKYIPIYINLVESISIKLHKAITKQMEELGWL